MSSASWIAPFVEHWGLWGLGIDVFLESIGLPFPGETLLAIASGMAATGSFDIRWVATVAFVAAVLGDNLGYLIGRWYGRPVIVARGARFGITHERMDHAERLIARWGPGLVVIARFIILLRQLNGLTAGTVGMAWHRFLVANILGAALWVGVWTTLVYRFGATVHHLLPALWKHVSHLSAIIVPVTIALVLLAWWQLARRAQRRRQDGQGR